LKQEGRERKERVCRLAGCRRSWCMVS